MSEPAKPEIIQKIEKLLERYSFRLPKPKPPALSPQGLPYATFHRRMMGATFDALIIMFMVTPFNGLILSMVYADLPPQPTREDMVRVLAGLFQVQYAIFAVFSFLFWHWKAATPGKLFLGMRIVDAKTGAPITDFQGIIRLLAYPIAGMPAMLGFFAIGISKRKQGWHDLIAGTAVVVDPKSGFRAGRPSNSPGPKEGE